ncbi:MAG: hypothetical protein HRU29_06410 [Rhizobiales bacterium]|nr:hypothetical protein [Hyphomicrobiales bacterium]NRB14017.1 hypothetical protein [Hyphomicrobiales bacterium]
MNLNLLKKSAIILTASVSILSMPMAAEVAKFDALNYVPDNTAIFSGNLVPFSLKTYLNLNQTLFNIPKPENFDEVFEYGKRMQKFGASIANEYFETIGDTDKFMQRFGFADDIRILFYTVDFSPVLKYEAANPQAIIDILDRAAEKTGFKAIDKISAGKKYKSYKPVQASANAPAFAVAIDDGWVTITLEYETTDNKHLEIALGGAKPNQSFGQTDTLQKLNDKYEFDSTQLLIINHEVIVDKITGTKPIDYITQEDWQGMADIQTPECRAEYASIAAAWPRTVAGNKSFSISENSYSSDSLLIIESTNQTTNSNLMDMRGYIPHSISNVADKIFSFALGINVDKLPTALINMWADVMQTSYKCESLIEMQTNLAEANPAILGAFTGMAQGIMGISLDVYKADLDEASAQPKLKTLDALLSLAAQNPAGQLAMASLLAPGLALLALPEDGTPVDLNDYMIEADELGGITKIAAVGQHLNIFQGETAAKTSAGMKNESIDPNGLFSYYFNYSKFYDILQKVAELQNEPIPEQMQSLVGVDLEVEMGIDFSENGIEFAVKLDLNK